MGDMHKMNEYAKIMWQGNYGTRKEAGVTAKWYHYVLSIFLNTLYMLLMCICLISFIGWALIYMFPPDEILDAIDEKFNKHNIYFTRNGATYARINKFLKENPNIDFCKKYKMFVPVNISAQAWLDVIIKLNKHRNIRLRQDLNLTDTDMLNISRFINTYIDDKDKVYISDVNRNVIHNVAANGLYFTITKIDDKFFNTYYGKKLSALNYRYHDNYFFAEDANDNDFVNLTGTENELLNHGKISLSVELGLI
mgnify:CR=1 FL=1